jgi:DNA (cytosine-5)-methyltransferase 1
MKAAVRIGSLCTGYGGLDIAAVTVFGGQLVWCADSDKHVAIVLAIRYPGIPNLGDVTRLDWGQVAAVDIITAGFPCQDISVSGRGAGIEKGAKSGIWKNIVRGIRALRPQLVIVENVAGIKRRGLDRVLGDLAALRYHAVWTSLRASDVGAAHRRERVFILGYQSKARALLLAAHAARQRRSRWTTTCETTGGWTPGGSVRPDSGPLSPARPADDEGAQSVGEIAWRRYGAAIRRWEVSTGRRVPEPTEPGIRGQARLSPLLSEWLMGLPKGFVTDLGLPYNAQHRVLGNGVVPQQAIAALRLLIAIAADDIVGSSPVPRER